MQVHLLYQAGSIDGIIYMKIWRTNRSPLGSCCTVRWPSRVLEPWHRRREPRRAQAAQAILAISPGAFDQFGLCGGVDSSTDGYLGKGETKTVLT